MSYLQLYTLEYSTSQDAYHIARLGEIIKVNLDMIYRGKSNDYLLIGVFNSYEEAFEFMNRHKPSNPTRIISDIV